MPLHVLFVIDSLGRGGAERSLAEMLPRLKQAGIDTTTVCLRPHAEGVQSSVQSQGFDVRILRNGGILKKALMLRKLVAAERPSLIHTTLFNSNLVGRLAAVGIGVPVLSSLVSMPYAPSRLSDPGIRRWKMKIVQAVDAWTSRLLTAHFHAITEAAKAAAVADLGISQERITVVKRGRNPEWLGRPSTERKARVRDSLELRDGHEVLLNVGRQDYQKGQRYLLEAFAEVAERRPPAVLLIAGRQGHATPELERVVEQLNLGEKVRFLGHRNDVPDILASADVFVFPSVVEGLGGAAIEAMALGLPIVASDLPSLREVVVEGENALLVEPGSSADLARAIEEILSDREMVQAFGERSRDLFERRFMISEITKQMIALYRAVAEHTLTLSAPPPTTTVSS